MSFVGKIFRGVGRVLGLVPKTPKVPEAPQAPTMADVGAETTQRQLAALMGGRTSTMLTGGSGEDEEKLKTSKVLLGSGGAAPKGGK